MDDDGVLIPEYCDLKWFSVRGDKGSTLALRPGAFEIVPSTRSTVSLPFLRSYTTNGTKGEEEKFNIPTHGRR